MHPKYTKQTPGESPADSRGVTEKCNRADSRGIAGRLQGSRQCAPGQTPGESPADSRGVAGNRVTGHSLHYTPGQD